MPDIGRQVLSTQIGNDLMVLYNLKQVGYKAAGATVDWDTVTAVSGSAVTLKDNSIVAVGQKALRYGQVICEITSGPSAGKVGPFDPDATDGRQTLTRGKCWVLNQTILENGPLPGLFAGVTTQIGNLIFRGTVWFARLIVGSQTNELGGPAGPSVAAFEAAFNQIEYAR